MSRIPSLRRLARDLPLFWKLLVPFLVLVLLLGITGTFLVVRNLGERAEADLDRVLAERSLAARSVLHDQELYLVEAAGFAANLNGMAAAVRSRDTNTIRQLLESVLALKDDVTLLAVTDPQGAGLAQFTRDAASARPTLQTATSWAPASFVRPVLGASGELTRGGFIEFGEGSLLALATTVCSGTEGCGSVGAVVVGLDVGGFPRLAAKSFLAGTSARGGGVGIYDVTGAVAARSRAITRFDHLSPRLAHGFVRENERVDGADLTALYSPVTIQGEHAGTLVVTLPRGPAFASARGTGVRLAMILLVALVGIVAIGAGLSRFILGQVRTLLATNRALGAGDLSSRAPVLGRDELGELAEGVNHMAAQLQESYADLEAKVLDRTAEVERLLKERTDFFTAVSHEFRTPLAVILGQAQLLGDAALAKPAAWNARSAGVITEAGDQLLTFVNDILDIAKAEAGRIELEPGKVRLEPLVASLQSSMEQLAAQNGVALVVRLPRRLPSVWADGVRLREILSNLVDNAIKYTPRGGEVTISAKQEQDFVAVSVVDTGVGIPADELPRLFEPFYRVKSVATQGGQPSSGLGLALVDRLVRAQDGEVRVVSSPGDGTVVTFTVPVARRDTASSVSRSSSSGSTGI
ncbi:MAG TPA: HAMP domain-containing sensor histidine kinase [Acidimicrobiales bacterium]|nr:HAMP domain-containing sensor histidine kinase [Acidimicrobiales bacterium]